MTFTLAPHAPYTVDVEHLRLVATLSAELDLPVLIHLAEKFGAFLPSQQPQRAALFGQYDLQRAPVLRMCFAANAAQRLKLVQQAGYRAGHLVDRLGQLVGGDEKDRCCLGISFTHNRFVTFINLVADKQELKSILLKGGLMLQ